MQLQKQSIMRVSLPAGKTTKHFPPPIPLERPEKKALSEGECLTLKLKSVPTDENSQFCELSIPHFSTGTPEEWFKFRRDLDRVFTGQNLTTGPQQCAMVRRPLDGDALTKFNESATATGDETLPNLSAVLGAVTTHVMPQRALAHQKRCMRRFMRKPLSVTARSFVARVNELNTHSSDFPPFNENQAPPQDEIVDILEFAIPNRWRNQATSQGFDIMIHTPTEFVEFCERIELVETNEEKSPGENSNKEKATETSHKRGFERKSEDSEGSAKKDCLPHGENCGHTTDECKVLKSQADKMKATYKTQSPSGKKAWKKREETDATVQAVMQQMTANERRKTISDSDNSEGELQLNELREQFRTQQSSDSDESC